jgi:hypothetical protein
MKGGFWLTDPLQLKKISILSIFIIFLSISILRPVICVLTAPPSGCCVCVSSFININDDDRLYAVCMVVTDASRASLANPLTSFLCFLFSYAVVVD